MRNLTSLDAFFLATEDARTTLNVSSLVIFDKARKDKTLVTRDDIVELIRSRLHLLPPLRWRLAGVPLGIAHPQWVDGEVDLDFHIRELGVPAPGGIRELEQQVARIAVHPMDRSRPLWEVYLFHGLSGNRVALLTKLHHAAVDGVSGAEIMSILLDGEAEGREIPPSPRRRPEAAPGQLSMLLRGIAALPGQQVDAVRAAVKTSKYLDQVPTLRGVPGTRITGRVVRGIIGGGADGDVLDAPADVAPRAYFNGLISSRRRLALLDLPLDDIRAIKTTYGATVNDVVVAMCAGALRNWLASTGDLPEKPLVAAIPVSVRTGTDAKFGNKVGSLVIAIPTDEPDPITRLERTRDALRSAKDRHKAVPASLMRDANDLVPPILFGRAMRAITRVAASDAFDPATNLVISNVPGSRSPLYCAGARVLAHYPVSVIADSLGVNITLFSYLDQLNVGLVADPELVPDVDGLAEAMTEELAVLLAESASTGSEGKTR